MRYLTAATVLVTLIWTASAVNGALTLRTGSDQSGGNKDAHCNPASGQYGTMCIYENGDLITSQSASYTLATTPGNAPFPNVAHGQDAWTIGYFPGSAWWTGQLDEIGIWDRVLSASEIQDMYKQGASY